MYEVYYYSAKNHYHAYYNIRDTITNTSTGCKLSIPIALTAPFTFLLINTSVP